MHDTLNPNPNPNTVIQPQARDPKGTVEGTIKAPHVCSYARQRALHSASACVCVCACVSARLPVFVLLSVCACARAGVCVCMCDSPPFA